MEIRTLLAGVSDTDNTLHIELAGAEKLSIVAHADRIRLSTDVGVFSDNGVTGGLISGLGTNEILVSFSSSYSTIKISDTAAGSGVIFSDSGANSYPVGFDIALDDLAASHAVLFEGATSFGDNDVQIVADGQVHLRAADVSVNDGTFGVTVFNTGDTSKDGEGVELFNSTLTTTGAGSISLNGTGTTLGNDLEGRVGVRLSGSTIHSTSIEADAGTISLVGVGGSSRSFDTGLWISNGSNVSSVTGDISLLGTGAAVGEYSHYGIILKDSTVRSTGTGPDAARITMEGHGGGAIAWNVGLSIDASNVISADGRIAITGYGGNSSGTSNIGVAFHGGTIIQSIGIGEQAATIDVRGFGGAGTHFNEGFRADDTTISSVDGNVTLVGLGGVGATHSNRGIRLTTTTIESTGNGRDSADIMIDGMAQAGDSWNAGLRLSTGTAIRAVDGSIVLKGQGNGSATNNNGVVGIDFDEISSTGTAIRQGRIRIEGHGGDGAVRTSSGVYLRGLESRIRIENASLEIVGRGGVTNEENSSNNHGIHLTEDIVIDAGTGVWPHTSVTLNGTAGSGSSRAIQLTTNDVAPAPRIRSVGGSINLVADPGASTALDAVFLSDGAIIETLLGGGSLPIDIRTDSMELAATSVIRSSGALQIRPFTPGTSIGLGGAPGTLNLTDAELERLSDGFLSVQFGDSETGTLHIDTVTLSDPVKLSGSIITDAEGIDITSDGLELSGAVSPGASGEFRIDSPSTRLAEGSLVIDVNGPVAGPAGPGFHDRLFTTGSFDVFSNSDLVVRRGEWYGIPAHQFTFVSRINGSATFGEYREGVIVPAAWNATISYQPNDISLTLPNILPAGPVTTTRPKFEWIEIQDALSYELYVERLGGQADPVIDMNLTGTVYDSDFDLEIGRYRSWVRARLVGGQRSEWTSTTFSITQRTQLRNLTSPSYELRPRIAWDPTPGAVAYRVYVVNLTTRVSPVLDVMTSSTSLTPDFDLSFGKHRIWVQPIGFFGFAGQWSAPIEYDITPQLLTPSGPSFNNVPEFTWTALPDIASTQLWVQQGGNVVINQSGLEGSAFQVDSTLADGDYRWWIRQTAANGRTGPWSERGNFSIGGRTRVLSPAGTTADNPVTITWEAVDGATSYEVFLYDDDAADMVLRKTVDANVVTTSPLPDNNYRVWVRAWKDQAPAAWSRSVPFRINSVKSDAAAVPQSPISPTLETRPTFQWTGLQNAAESEIFLTNIHTVFHQKQLTQSSWTPGGDLSAEVWTWQVRATNAAGEAGRGSNPVSVDLSGRAMILTTQQDIQDNMPFVSWTPVADAQRYLLRVDNVTTEETFAVSRNDLTAATFQLPVLTAGDYRLWIKAIGSHGHDAPWSEAFDFRIANV